MRKQFLLLLWQWQSHSLTTSVSGLPGWCLWCSRGLVQWERWRPFRCRVSLIYDRVNAAPWEFQTSLSPSPPPGHHPKRKDFRRKLPDWRLEQLLRCALQNHESNHGSIATFIQSKSCRCLFWNWQKYAWKRLCVDAHCAASRDKPFIAAEATTFFPLIGRMP